MTEGLLTRKSTASATSYHQQWARDDWSNLFQHGYKVERGFSQNLAAEKTRKCRSWHETGVGFYGVTVKVEINNDETQVRKWIWNFLAVSNGPNEVRRYQLMWAGGRAERVLGDNEEGRFESGVWCGTWLFQKHGSHSTAWLRRSIWRRQQSCCV